MRLVNLQRCYEPCPVPAASKRPLFTSKSQTVEYDGTTVHDRVQDERTLNMR